MRKLFSIYLPSVRLIPFVFRHLGQLAQQPNSKLNNSKSQVQQPNSKLNNSKSQVQQPNSKLNNSKSQA